MGRQTQRLEIAPREATWVAMTAETVLIRLAPEWAFFYGVFA